MSMDAEDARFFAAALWLHLQAGRDGRDGSLHDVEATLCEDDKTVLIYASDSRGEILSATYELSSPIDPASFDAREIEDAFNPTTAGEETIAAPIHTGGNPDV